MGLIISQIWEKLFGTEEHRILMVGLDGAGKTTILYKIKLGEVVTTIPTIGFNVETVQYKNINFTVWDIGGQDKIRPLWRHYYSNAQAIIFVIDSNDKQRINNVKNELDKLLSEPLLDKSKLLLFANKQDLQNVLNWYIQGCCATNGDGLFEGLDWLSEALKSK